MQGAGNCTGGRKDRRGAGRGGQPHLPVGVGRLLCRTDAVWGRSTREDLLLPSVGVSVRPLPLWVAKLQLRLLRVGPTLPRFPPCVPGRLAAVLFPGGGFTGTVPTAWAQGAGAASRVAAGGVSTGPRGPRPAPVRVVASGRRGRGRLMCRFSFAITGVRTRATWLSQRRVCHAAWPLRACQRRWATCAVSRRCRKANRCCLKGTSVIACRIRYPSTFVSMPRCALAGLMGHLGAWELRLRDSQIPVPPALSGIHRPFRQDWPAALGFR